jgi:hypothetical protein
MPVARLNTHAPASYPPAGCGARASTGSGNTSGEAMKSLGEIEAAIALAELFRGKMDRLAAARVLESRARPQRAAPAADPPRVPGPRSPGASAQGPGRQRAGAALGGTAVGRPRASHSLPRRLAPSLHALRVGPPIRLPTYSPFAVIGLTPRPEPCFTSKSDRLYPLSDPRQRFGAEPQSHRHGPDEVFGNDSWSNTPCAGRSSLVWVVFASRASVH